MKFVAPLALLISLAACTPQPQAATPTSPDPMPTPAQTETASPPAGSAEPVENGMKYTVNTGFGSEPGDSIMIEIGQVLVLPEGLKMGVTIRNDSDTPVDFDPVQGTRVVVGGKILHSNPLVNDGDGDLSGNYQPRASRSGEILFPAPKEAPLDVEQIDRVRLYMDLEDGPGGNSQMEFKLK